MIRMQFFAMVLLFVACSREQRQAAQPEGQLALNSLSKMLPDSLFGLKTLRDTRVLEIKDYRITFLNSIMMQRIVADCPGLNHRSYWIMHDWQATYISRHNPIGNFTPIIISVAGTDYASVILIMLDWKGNPVSHLILRGGECDGSALCDVSNSKINNHKIETYRVKYVSNPDENLFIMVDSVTYSSRILENGMIETTKRDSLRYRRKFF